VLIGVAQREMKNKPQYVFSRLCDFKRLMRTSRFSQLFMETRQRHDNQSSNFRIWIWSPGGVADFADEQNTHCATAG
jgi:hypothetical protein